MLRVARVGVAIRPWLLLLGGLSDHITSGESMPSSASPVTSTASVRAHSARRESRTYGVCGLDHRAVLVERRELVCHLEQMSGQPMRFERGA